MVNRKNLVAIGPELPDSQAADQAVPEAPFSEAAPLGEPVTLDEEWIEEDEAVNSGRFGWIVPSLAILAVLAWTGFFGWVHQQTLLAGASPAQWSRWIVDWSVPVLLVVGLWLLAMRNSRRESARFAVAANALSRESSLLERRLTTVHR